MDFFKSVFSDDPDPRPNASVSESSKKEEEEEEEDDDPYPDSSPNAQNSNPNPNSPLGGGGQWSFEGLIKTLSSKSESVIETYSRDLKEFGSGLKKETATFGEVASRAVKELSTSIEAGASAAQGSLETVGQTIDEFGSSVWRGTADIISHGKDTLLTLDHETEPSNNQNYSNQSHNLMHYNRFDARVRAIQSDLSTYSEEPEDLDEYDKWKIGFVLEVKEVERLFEENGAMERIYERIVPNEINHDTFWCRYYYRVYKLKQAENLRANLVKRAISMEDEEDLSWDVDDDDGNNDNDHSNNEKEKNVSSKAELLENKELGGIDSGRIGKEENSNSVEDSRVEDSRVLDEKRENRSKSIDESSEKGEFGSKDPSQVVQVENFAEESQVWSSGDVDERGKNRGSNVDDGGNGIVAESSSSNVTDEKMQPGRTSEVNSDESVSKSDEKKMVLERKTDPKNNDFTVVSSRPSSLEEEDLSWDEIEDLGSSSDEKKVTRPGSPNRADLQKRLSANDEDLSWDIEDDDDEPVKA